MAGLEHTRTKDPHCGLPIVAVDARDQARPHPDTNFAAPRSQPQQGVWLFNQICGLTGPVVLPADRVLDRVERRSLEG